MDLVTPDIGLIFWTTVSFGILYFILAKFAWKPILGAVNVPIIKFSVDWWNTLHQPASINILSTNTAIHPSMLVPLGIMTAAFALFSLLIFLMKYNTELIKVKNKGLDRL